MTKSEFYESLQRSKYLVYLADKIQVPAPIKDCSINNVYLFTKNILSEKFLQVCLAIVGNSKSYFIKELNIGYLIGLSKEPLGPSRRGTVIVNENIELIFISSHAMLGETLTDIRVQLRKEYIGEDKNQVEQVLSNINDFEQGHLTIKYVNDELFYQILTNTVLIAFTNKELSIVATKAFEIRREEDGSLVVSR